MRTRPRILPTLLLTVCAFVAAAEAKPLVIRAARVLDGRGHSYRNAAVIVDGGKIVRIDEHPTRADLDLGDRTLLPGGIDTHVHIAWPNIDLVFRNYFENRAHYLGIGNYTEEGFAQMKLAVPKALNVFRMGLKTPGLKMVFGTDAVAGSHGRNFQELEYRVREGGQKPMEAIVSATSLAAESLGLGDRIGSIAPGYEADLIAVDGDPLAEIGALERVSFVMKGGRIYKERR